MKYFLVSGFLLISIIFTETQQLEIFGDHLNFQAINKTTEINNLKEGWIEQNLDNFDSKNTKLWNMRYFFNDQYYKNGGPIFIYIGNGAENVNVFIENGLIVDIGKEVGAILFAPENRYFGMSQPTSDLSFNNLQYFKINQTLADLAVFIKNIKKNVKGLDKAKVILFGTNYGATLAAWFRQKYSDLVDGVWASSAFVNTQLEFDDYFIDIGKTIDNILKNKECSRRITRAFNQIDEIIKTGNASRIEQIFNVYEPILLNDPNEIFTFFSTLANLFAVYVEFGDLISIEFACNLITNRLIEDDIEAFSQIVKNLVGDNKIHVSLKESMEIYGNESWQSYGVSVGGRQIYYRTCMEIATLKISSNKQIFGNRFPLDVFVSACQLLFGNTLTKETIKAGSDYTNSIYGGFNPNVTNVIFTNGELDPFRLQSITENLNSETPAIQIPFVGKSFDMNSISENDRPETKAAKEKIRKQIIKWIS